ncbi:hypothetical protein [Asanoa iriomotensis]|uniref:Uncharacterized protein n=1 Tax=Asanoa iriomotensis TaxID=234613 RepID=A0ABQ4CFI8_9ACTN|nr:hypothetical protein [Asanoa iriomotensis]GIF61533.1 hypothetical protein Air01nite_76280 [Asanoa iriomotensis]
MTDRLTTAATVAGCPVCGSTRPDLIAAGACYTCEFWQEQFANPGGLIISGNHYRICAEPPGEKLAAFPKGYGCYGVGFLIRRHDGTEIVTHNLWHQGEIPPGLARPDNAVFIAVGDQVPKPEPSHRHADHLFRYTNVSDYAYQCIFDDCGNWYTSPQEAAQSDDRVTAYLHGGGA